MKLSECQVTVELLGDECGCLFDPLYDNSLSLRASLLLWFHPTGALVCANRTHGSCPSALGALVAFGEAKGVTITASFAW